MAEKKARRRAKGEGSVFQRADGLWAVQIDLGYVNGKRHRPVKYARTQREAIALGKEMERRHHDGLPAIDSSQKLSGYLHWWLDNVVEVSDLAPRTKASYRAEVENHIIPTLGRHPLGRLQTKHVTEWMAAMAKEAEANAAQRREADGDNAKPFYEGTPSRNTRRIRYAVLHRALNLAVDQGLIGRNPASAVQAPRPERDPEKVHSLTIEEAQAILKAADKHRLRACWYVLVMMGLRRGEVLGLRWRDIDFNTSTLHINQTLSRVQGLGLVFGTPKTDMSQRSCPIPLLALDVLKTHWAKQEIARAEHGGWPDNDLVFVTASGKPIEPSNLGRMFNTVCKKAGHRHERLHNLRHTAATVMRVHGGADLLDVSRLLGHSSIRVTADMYGHTVPTVQEQIASRVSDAFATS